MYGRRIRQLRLARGLSLKALSTCMGGLVSKQALSKYEQERARPSAMVLARLAQALDVKVGYLVTVPNLRTEFLAFRKQSRLRKREQERVLGLVAERLEALVRLQGLTGMQEEPLLPIQGLSVSSADDAEAAAACLRQVWQLGLDPIANVVDLLEHHSVHVIEIEAGEGFDGISAAAYDASGQLRAAAAVTRRGLPGERQRLNLAHELGHLTLRLSSSVDVERAAFRFAGAFLAPCQLLLSEVGQRRHAIHLHELLLLKRRFGMSLQALLYRLRDLAIISDSHYKNWCVEISRQGWRRKEPCELPTEQPQWACQAALRALSEGLIGPEEAYALTNGNVNVPLPDSLAHRRNFLRLPLEERRSVLAQQAEDLAHLYSQGDQWHDLETGELAEQ